MGTSAQIISIGNELLLGHILNSNTSYISRNLLTIGIKTSCHISIPDDPETIALSIKGSLRNSDIVVITGGLGPTVDDVTLKSIASALSRRLIFKKNIAVRIKEDFKKRRLKMPSNNLRQAFIPEGAKPILNNIGTAPGLIIPLPIEERGRVRGDRVLIALPGVPFELYPMFEKKVLPYLKKQFHPDKIIKSRVIKITGLPESKVNEKIEDILKIKGDVQMGIYPHPEEITVKITVTGQNQNKVETIIRDIEKKIFSRLGNYIFGYDDETLEQVVGDLLLKNKKSLSIAESCTGGLLGNRITDVPGSSRYFKMGAIVYSNASKNKILNIPMEELKTYGAVSKNIAISMAKNVRELGSADIGIAISGIAGPGGATDKKPVGLVYIAISTKRKSHCREFRFSGQREIIKYKATQAALNILRLICLQSAVL